MCFCVCHCGGQEENALEICCLPINHSWSSGDILMVGDENGTQWVHNTKWYAVVMLPTESLLPRSAPRAWKTWVAVASCPHWIRMAPLFLERRESSPRGYVTKIQRPEHFQIHLYNRLIRIGNQFLWVSQVLTRAISIQSTNNWDL